MNVQKGLGDTSIKYKELPQWNWKTTKRKFMNKIPSLSTLTIHKNGDTCKFCRGDRYKQINHENGTMTLITCQRCKGKGVFKN